MYSMTTQARTPGEQIWGFCVNLEVQQQDGANIYRIWNYYIKTGYTIFLQYDSGEMVSVIKIIEISEHEAKELQEQKDGKTIYDYMIKNLNDRI